MRWRGARAAVVLCLSGGLAHAESDSYWVDWSAPQSCPDVSRLHSEIAAHAPALRLSRAAVPTRVEVSKDAAGYYTARAVLPDGEVRDLEAISCADVLSALAFIIALRLGGQEKQEAQPQAAIGAEPHPAPANDAPGPVSEWSSYAGASAGVQGGLTPNLMPTGGLLFELWQRGGRLGARAGLSLGSGRLATSPAVVTLRSAAATLDLCPLGVSWGAICGGVDLGALDVSSGRALANTERLRFSASGRASALLRFVYADRWLGELSGGLTLPMTLDDFVIERRDGTFEQVHAVGVSGFANVSIGYRL